mgnify:CR=1 FL=1
MRFFFFFGFWVWKRKVLGLEEKPFLGTGKRRKKEIWVLGLEEKGHGWFGRERFWVWKRSRLQYRKKKEERGKKIVLTSFA